MCVVVVVYVCVFVCGFCHFFVVSVISFQLIQRNWIRSLFILFYLGYTDFFSSAFCLDRLAVIHISCLHCNSTFKSFFFGRGGGVTLCLMCWQNASQHVIKLLNRLECFFCLPFLVLFDVVWVSSSFRRQEGRFEPLKTLFSLVFCQRRRFESTHHPFTH